MKTHLTSLLVLIITLCFQSTSIYAGDFHHSEKSPTSLTEIEASKQLNTTESRAHKWTLNTLLYSIEVRPISITFPEKRFLFAELIRVNPDGHSARLGFKEGNEKNQQPDWESVNQLIDLGYPKMKYNWDG